MKGLRLIDPWGDLALVRNLEGDNIWLIYDGLDVPFERSLDSMVDAANGILRQDKSQQFVKSFVLPSGIGLALHYEPFWTSSCQSYIQPLKTNPKRSRR